MWLLTVPTSHQCELIEFISTAIEQLPIDLIVLPAFSNTGLKPLPPELIYHRVIQRCEVVGWCLVLQKIKANHLGLGVYAIADPLYDCSTKLTRIVAPSCKAYFTRLKNHQAPRRSGVLNILLWMAKTGLYLERKPFD